MRAYVISVSHKYGSDVLPKAFYNEDEAYSHAVQWLRDTLTDYGYNEDDVEASIESGDALRDDTYYSVEIVDLP